MAKKLKVDIVEQAEIGKDVPPESDVVGESFKILKQAADVLKERGENQGALIVIGTFASAGEIADARDDLRPNPFKGQYVSVGDKFFLRMVLQGAVGEGAVIADESGQILGGGIMLVIDHPDAEVPEGGFMRHLAAASTSMRKQVSAVLTLSEENTIARVFKNGKVESEYDPAAEEKAAAQKAADDLAAEEKKRAQEQKEKEEKAEAARIAAEATQVVPPPKKKKAKRTTARKKRKKKKATAKSVRGDKTTPKEPETPESVVAEPEAATEDVPRPATSETPTDAPEASEGE